MNNTNRKVLLQLRKMLYQHLKVKDCKYRGITDMCHIAGNIDQWLFCEWADRLYETIEQLGDKP